VVAHTHTHTHTHTVTHTHTPATRIRVAPVVTVTRLASGLRGMPAGRRRDSGTRIAAAALSTVVQPPEALTRRAVDCSPLGRRLRPEVSVPTGGVMAGRRRRAVDVFTNFSVVFASADPENGLVNCGKHVDGEKITTIYQSGSTCGA
jgi:hypothetical protein